MTAHIQQLLRRLRSDIVTGHIRQIPDQRLVTYAQELQVGFSLEQSATPSRHALARMLIYIYNTLQRRISDSLITDRIDIFSTDFDTPSPLSGTLEHIPVFNYLDIWISSLNEYTPSPHHPRPRRSNPVPHPTIQTQRQNTVVQPPPGPNELITEQEAITLFQTQNRAATTTENSAIETAGQALEIVNFVAGVGELGLEIAAVTGAAASLGTFLSFFGLGTAIVGSIVGLIGAWASADRLGEFNARCQGYWNALDDMASRFSSPDFLRMSRNQWPPLREAVPHLQPMPREAEEQLSTAVQAWRRGEQQGCREAITLIQRFATNPHRWNRPNGQTLVIDDGRIFLHAMYVGFRGNVRARIQEHIDREIRRQNEGRGWPLLR